MSHGHSQALSPQGTAIAPAFQIQIPMIPSLPSGYVKIAIGNGHL